MLTLTRSVGETIRIGDDIEVHVVEVRGGTVRLGFTDSTATAWVKASTAALALM